jgi:hypothetical protein
MANVVLVFFLVRANEGSLSVDHNVGDLCMLRNFDHNEYSG